MPARIDGVKTAFESSSPDEAASQVQSMVRAQTALEDAHVHLDVAHRQWVLGGGAPTTIIPFYGVDPRGPKARPEGSSTERALRFSRVRPDKPVDPAIAVVRPVARMVNYEPVAASGVRLVTAS